MTIAIADWQRFGRRGHAADAVRAKLCSLESGETRVLEAVPAGPTRHEIDHVVIGPAGIFTVALYEERGREMRVSGYGMTVDGESVPYLRQAKLAAEQVARALTDGLDFDVPVRGCAVLLTGSHKPQVTYDTRPIGVSLLTKSDVPRWFERQPVALTTEQVEALFAAARRSIARA